MRATVETRYGRLAGEEKRGTWLFRGVPYARAPRGELRFRAPEPPEPWGGVRDALATGPSAPQPVPPLPAVVRRTLGLRRRRWSEDCLSLNVWTPGCDGARRPVMVWLHGGAFLFGSGATPIYSGRRLARKGDVVVVNINYRLGALGWLHLEELLGQDGPITSNCGLRDQIAALEWVRDNIEGFGGDPDNVTVFGESAGAMSVGALLGAPRARSLFHRAVMQSGAAHNVSSSNRGTAVAEFFLGELGLAPTEAEQLRELPIEALLEAQHRTCMRLGLRSVSLPFQPVVDGHLIPRARIAELLPGRDADGTRKADRALAIYRRERLGRGGLDAHDMWVAFQSDRVFRYPATRLSELHAAQGRTYAYLLDWSPAMLRERLGACHGLELPLLFGTHRHPGLRPFLGIGSGPQVARNIQNAWIAFAHTGNPSAESVGAWAAYTPDRRETMVLGEQPYLEETPLESERAFWEGRLPE